MTISSSSRCTEALFSRWSSSLPGVAITMSGCARSDWAWSCARKPPATSWCVTDVYLARSLSIAWHCTASSRVGIRTMAFVAGWSTMRRPSGPRLRARTVGLWQSRSRIGSRKEAVLPEPVSAVASTSRPRSAGGITSLCMGVGVSNLSSATARSSGLERRSSAKCMPVLRWPSVSSCRAGLLASLSFLFFAGLGSGSAGGSGASSPSSSLFSCSRCFILASRPRSCHPSAPSAFATSAPKFQPPAPGSLTSSSSSLIRSLNLKRPFFASCGPSSSPLASASPSSWSTVPMRSAMGAR
mmetsp:Transcript_111871/g.316482  ORF Transcript_111871/g.316482 Transcript_111871/m.316482 type:complete len:298 (-) Transcript_111871:52-945(-)